MRTRALLVTGPGQVELGEIELPPLGPGDVLVAAAWTCVSPGTELRNLHDGGLPPSTWPYVPGYTLTGTVVDRGPGVDLAVGTRVFCGNAGNVNVTSRWGGHAAHAVARADAVVPLPDGVSLREAPLCKLAAIAWRGTRFSRPRPGLRVAVVGLGPIGQLSARIHAALGADTVGLDLRADRVATLRAAGVPALHSTGELAAACRELWPEGADVVVDATGAPKALAATIEVARDQAWDAPAGTNPVLVVQGSYLHDLPVPYDPAFFRELAVYFPRDQQHDDLAAALQAMGAGSLPLADLISAERDPADAPSVYAELARPDTPWLTVAFRWHEPADAT